MKGRIRKPQHYRNGYAFIAICKDGRQRGYTIHRLVAQTFIPNPKGMPEVNHKDENKLNNCVENLEWVSVKENRLYGSRLQRTIAHRDQRGTKNGMYGRKGAKSPVAKAVRQFTIDGEFIAEFSTIKEAAKATGNSTGNVRSVLKGKTSQAKGYIFKLK